MDKGPPELGMPFGEQRPDKVFLDIVDIEVLKKNLCKQFLIDILADVHHGEF